MPPLLLLLLILISPVAHIVAAHASGGAQIVATKCGASPFAVRFAPRPTLRQQLVSAFVTARTQVEQELSTGTVHRFVYSWCWYAICHAHDDAHAQCLLHLMAICSRWAARRFTSCKFVAYSLSRTTPPMPPRPHAPPIQRVEACEMRKFCINCVGAC